MMNEGYLEGLVKSMGKDPQEFFGRHIGKLKHDLYHQIIKPKLAASLPKEELYIVATQEKFCTYENRNSKWHITPNRLDERNSNGKLSTITNYLTHLIGDNRAAKKFIVVNSIFLNEDAKINFEELVAKLGLKFIGPRDIDAKDYGTITIFSYATT